MISSVFGKIVNFVLALVFCIYILLDKENIKVKFDKLFVPICVMTAGETLCGFARNQPDIF